MKNRKSVDNGLKEAKNMIANAEQYFSEEPKQYIQHYTFEPIVILENYLKEIYKDKFRDIAEDFHYLWHDNEGIYYYRHKNQQHYLCLQEGNLIEGSLI